MVHSYIAQYPVLRTAQSALHFTSLADMYNNQTPSQLLWEAFSHAAINVFIQISTTVYIASYLFMHGELERCRVKTLPKV